MRLQTFEMQQKLERQEKLYYKNKVSDIITSYEKQKQEEERQKTLMKKQIMLSIMNNRQKTTPVPNEKSDTSKQEKTFKTNISQDLVFDHNAIDNHSLVRPNITQPQSNPDSRFESEIAKESIRLDEITFNAKKRNKSLEEELNFKESYLNQLRERRQKEEYEEPREEDADVFQGDFAVEPLQNVQKSLYKSSRESDEEERQEEKGSNHSYFNRYSQAKESFPSRKAEVQKSIRYEQPEGHQEYDREEQEQQEIKAEPKGVFLTMEESESMVAEDQPKNIAFQIKMDKSADPDNFEELKKNKIKEIERKRQERIEQFRRNESQKKVEMPKGKNSYSKRADKQQNNESQVPPRSATIQRKVNNPSNAPIAKKSEKEPVSRHLIPLQAHQSQYNVRPNSSKQIPSNFSHHQLQQKPPSYKQIHCIQDREPKPLSPFKTPKTIYSENNRGKSNGKNTNIFTIDNQGREKSCNKYNEPKIEPKDRKNSFTRQSNKKLMINAITHVIFPGELNRKQRERLIDIIDASQYEFFIFLFKEYSRKMIKGIYTFDSTQVYLRKIYGEKSPQEITADMVQQFYRFDSGSREFKKVDGCRSFSLSIHAIDLRK